jgi:6-pyruvoyltetrahydropterin/6-carboxytetrahydropterin synthase
MYEVTVEGHFSAAHSLVGYHGDCERLHGHNYRVRVAVRAPQLGPDGLALDFRDLKRALGAALGELDHRHINSDVPEFGPGRLNPSAENLARFVFGRLADGRLPGGLRPARVTVWESPGCSATYLEEV